MITGSRNPLKFKKILFYLCLLLSVCFQCIGLEPIVCADIRQPSFPKCAEFENTCYVISEFYLKFKKKVPTKLIGTSFFCIFEFIYTEKTTTICQNISVDLTFNLSVKVRMNLWGHGRAEISVFLVGILREMMTS